VWGVVIAGTENFPPENMKYIANVVAELLDPDSTGMP